MDLNASPPFDVARFCVTFPTRGLNSVAYTRTAPPPLPAKFFPFREFMKIYLKKPVTLLRVAAFLYVARILISCGGRQGHLRENGMVGGSATLTGRSAIIANSSLPAVSSDWFAREAHNGCLEVVCQPGCR